MPNGDVALGLAGLQEWSEPIIFDRLLDIYRGCLGVGVSAWSLARLHAGVWRAAIKGDIEKFETARAALTSALSEHPVGGEDIAAIDAEILTELLDIVMARFQRSSGAARAHHLALIALAGRLTPPAPAAAA